MKIAIYSDLHLEFAPFHPPPVDADAVVLAGDVHTRGRGAAWARKTFPKQEIIQVAGNHEFYGDHWDHTLSKMRRRAAEYGVHFLENNRVVICGVRFLGCTLWTDFALHGDRRTAMQAAARDMNDFRRISARGSFRTGDGYLGASMNKLMPEATLARHLESVEWLTRALREPFAGKTIVVTHHAPSNKSIPEEFQGDSHSAAYASNRDDLVALTDVWIHGHIHSTVDYTIAKARVIANPRGYVTRSGEDVNRGFNQMPELRV